ncbi:MAG TPA: hypothetical protein VM204_03555 [Gaiellaceae bacterium]|nr:hypothetical protein [Gaiellaceae bacterium]
MKKTMLAVAAVAALVTTSAAVAHLRVADVRTTAATFTATTPSNVQTRTLTCAGDTVEVTTGRWSGTATSTTAQLNGPIELYVKSVYNVTKKLGWADGWVKIRTSGNKVQGSFSAVNTNGTLDGWLRGSAGSGNGKLFGSLSGTFSKDGGLTAGGIGAGAAPNTALIAKTSGCKPQSTPRPSVRLLVRGDVEAVSTTAITVKPRDGSAAQSCAVRSAGQVDRVRVGDRVEMKCVQVGGAWQLESVKRK